MKMHAVEISNTDKVAKMIRDTWPELIETDVRSVRFGLYPGRGYIVLIERHDGTAIELARKPRVPFTPVGVSI